MKKTMLLLVSIIAAAMTAIAAEPNNSINAEFLHDVNSPEVPAKFAGDVREHMKNIERAVSLHIPKSEMIRNGEVVKLTIPCSELFFANDTVFMQNSVGADKLSLLTEVLALPTMYKVIVAVHADDTGDEQYVNNLTVARAYAVCDFLVKMANAETDKVNVVAYGLGYDPKEDNSNIAARAANRRVDIFIVPESDMILTAKAGNLKPR